MQQGIYLTNRDDLESLEEQWFDGKQIDIVGTTYTDKFTDITGITWDDSQRSHAEGLRYAFGEDTNRTISAVYYMGKGPAEYEAAAAGELDSTFREFGQQLVDLGINDAHLRINPEFNIDWSSRYPPDGDGELYRDAYARFVRELYKVDGANFQPVFSVGSNQLGIAPESWPPDSNMYPDEAPLPLVGPSIYDATGKCKELGDDVTDDVRKSTWEDKHAENNGKWVDFADERGAQMCSPEWGAELSGSDGRGAGCGDNPWFVQEMFDWFDRENFAYQVYWNGGGRHGVFRPVDLPRTADQLKEEMQSRLGTSDSGSDGNTSEENRTYGGYNQPMEGTLNWHIPLNENFADIEADIKDLAQRIEELE